MAKQQEIIDAALSILEMYIQDGEVSLEPYYTDGKVEKLVPDTEIKERWHTLAELVGHPHHSHRVAGPQKKK